jgi:glycine/D-amino acid oxidase-like deaminating enzyme
MPPPIRIVGQGLAGSLLAWSCEAAGIDFEIFDPGSSASATAVGAGLVNPVTGQRLVKSWRIEDFLPRALNLYRTIEAATGESLIQPYRVRRLYQDAREKTVAEEKFKRGELSPYVQAIDDEGFWIESAFRLDMQRLLAVLQARWIAQGRLLLRCGVEEKSDVLTIWCIGAAETKFSRFAFTRMQASRGELLTIAVSNLASGVILNRGHWILPLREGVAKLGATYDATDRREATASARATLLASARKMLSGEIEVLSQEVGLRMTTPDKHPVVGRHPEQSTIGIVNGLGSKGVLLAPYLAAQWIGHRQNKTPFDPNCDVRRFSR